jgi:hypothetical protein
MLEYDETDNDVSKELGKDYKENDTGRKVLPKRRREPLKNAKISEGQ